MDYLIESIFTATRSKVMKMNQEIKEKWLAALRSGKYKQGKTVLRSQDDCYCCLGVLCDIQDSGQWVPIDHPKDGACYVYSQDGELNQFDFTIGSEVLPAFVADNIGIRSVNPIVQMTSALQEILSKKGPVYTRDMAALSVLNDAGCSFEELANIIEEQF